MLRVSSTAAATPPPIAHKATAVTMMMAIFFVPVIGAAVDLRGANTSAALGRVYPLTPLYQVGLVDHEHWSYWPSTTVSDFSSAIVLDRRERNFHIVVHRPLF